MESFQFIKNIRLCKSMLPPLLFSISLLIFIDSFCNLMDHGLVINHVQQVSNRNSVTPLINVQDEIFSASTALNLPNLHHLLSPEAGSDTQTKHFHTIFVFCVEIFATVINFTASTICITSALCNFLLPQRIDQSGDRFFHVPFPRKHKWATLYPTLKYLEFFSFLAIIFGTFGSFMLVIALVWQYYVIFETLGNTTTNMATHYPSSGLDFYKFRIQKLSGIGNAFLSLFICLSLLGSLTNATRLCRTENKKWMEFETIESPNPDSLVPEKVVQQLGTKALWFCIRLVRSIISLSSILITSGGLLILGSALQWFLMTSEHVSVNEPILSFVRYAISLIGGFLSISAGSMSVVAVQCCSTPLEIIVSHRINTSRDSSGSINLLCWKFNRPFHLLTIFTCLLHIPLALGTHILLRKDNQTEIIESDKVWFDSSRIMQMGYALAYFANNATVLLTSVVFHGLVIDLAVRIKLLEIDPCASPTHPYVSSSTSGSALTRLLSANTEKHADILLTQMHPPGSVSKQFEKQAQSQLSPHSNINNSMSIPNSCNIGGIRATRNSIVQVNNHNDQKLHLWTGHGTRHSYPYRTSLSFMPEQNFQLDSPKYLKPTELRITDQPLYLAQPVASDSTLRGGQLVYACNSCLPASMHCTNRVQLTEKKRGRVHTFEEEYPCDSCEYMSCEFAQPASDFVKNDNEPVGFYYVDTCGEDFITSV